VKDQVHIHSISYTKIIEEGRKKKEKTYVVLSCITVSTVLLSCRLVINKEEKQRKKQKGEEGK